MQVAIVGLGYVGNAMLRVFPDAVQYDFPKGVGKKEAVNSCKLAVICVPTPSSDDGSCNTSIVEDTVKWLTTDLILIKSAVAPGTTDRLKKAYNKRIVVSPEYIGESKYYVPDRFLDPQNPLKHEFLILGGDDKDCSDVADVFAPRVGPVTRIRVMTAVEAEIVKYAENAFFATKVTFANELRDLCAVLGANWHRVREGWIDDPRVGPMHTAVFPRERGFGGKCFPKDTLALHELAKRYNVEMHVIEGVLKSNGRR